MMLLENLINVISNISSILLLRMETVETIINRKVLFFTVGSFFFNFNNLKNIRFRGSTQGHFADEM